jgi:hypothetical protein
LTVDWVALAFAVAFCQTFGWIYFDGRKRRSAAYREKVSAGLQRLPASQQPLLKTLFYPQKLHDRWVQAMVIGTCSLVLALPLYLPLTWWLSGQLWQPLVAIVLASYLAANLGEFLLNW